MRLSLVLLAVAATLLSSCNAFDGVNNGNRLLRTQETTNTANANGLTANDEERAWGLKTLIQSLSKLKTNKVAKVNDFAKADLDRMLTDVAFKREMFERWNQYSTEKILAALDLSKRKNLPYASMLQEFLNTYRLREGAKALRAGN